MSLQQSLGAPWGGRRPPQMSALGAGTSGPPAGSTRLLGCRLSHSAPRARRRPRQGTSQKMLPHVTTIQSLTCNSCPPRLLPFCPPPCALAMRTPQVTRDPEEEETKVWDHSRAPSRLRIQGPALPEEVRTLETLTGTHKQRPARRPPASALQGASDTFGTRQRCRLLVRVGAVSSKRRGECPAPPSPGHLRTSHALEQKRCADSWRVLDDKSGHCSCSTGVTAFRNLCAQFLPFLRVPQVWEARCVQSVPCARLHASVCALVHECAHLGACSRGSGRSRQIPPAFLSGPQGLRTPFTVTPMTCECQTGASIC